MIKIKLFQVLQYINIIDATITCFFKLDVLHQAFYGIIKKLRDINQISSCHVLENSFLTEQEISGLVCMEDMSRARQLNASDAVRLNLPSHRLSPVLLHLADTLPTII